MYHTVEYTYSIDEGAVQEVDLDVGLDQAEMEEIALKEIKSDFPEIYNIKIVKIEVA